MDLELLFSEQISEFSTNISNLLRAQRPLSQHPGTVNCPKMKKRKQKNKNIVNKPTVIQATSIKKQGFKILLNQSGSAYLTIEYLPSELIDLGYKCYQRMWELHPQKRHNVIMFQKEIQVNRYSKSYMNTPKDLSHLKRNSYMYSGYDTTANNNDLPQVFQPFYEYIKRKDERYNQAIVNWYQNQNDHIAQHSDCQKGMIQDPKVSIISFYPENSSQRFRHLLITPKINSKPLYNKLAIQMGQGMIITMHGTIQEQFRHGMEREKNPAPSRISLSFRQMK